MDLETTADTGASVDRVWAAFTDVTSWPSWSRSMTWVRRLDDGPLRVGSRARIKQPGMPVLVWEVSDLREHEVFSWTATSGGVRTVAHHRIGVNPDGTTRISLAVEQSGALAGLVRALTGKRTLRYIRMEAAALKAAAESPTPGTQGTAVG